MNLSSTFVMLAAVGGDPAAEAEPMTPPRLVVLLIADQVRPDYFDRFAPHLEGFFARMEQQGRWFVEAEQHHAFTVTAAGHACVGTGRFPSGHGIVGNEFYDPELGQKIGSTKDREALPVGDLGGGYSARRLLCDGLGDWWMQRYPDARRLGVSIKPRSALFPLGRGPHPAYWLNRAQVAFVSSSACMDELPAWVQQRAGPAFFERFPMRWETTLSAEQFAALGCTEDDVAAEIPTGAPKTRTFPHSLDDPRPPERLRALNYSAYADDLILDFARDAILEEGFGSDEVPDLLVVGLSGTDYIGHQHGPDSWEVCEQFLHLDRSLAEFAKFVEDRTDGNYLFVFTSDHGVQPIPEVAQARGQPGARVDWFAFETLVKETVRAFDPALVEAFTPTPYGGLRFHPDAVAEAGHTIDAVSRYVAAALRKHSGFATVRSHAELQDALEPNDRFGQLLRASSDGERAGHVHFVLPEGSIYIGPFTRAEDAARSTATTHGSAWPSDVQVPLVFLGPGVEPGKIPGRAYTVDIAPTIAALLDLSTPGDLDGVVLELTASAGNAAPEH